MTENYTKVEIVKPVKDYNPVANVLATLIMMALRVLIVWWAVATFFPELGLTYWQLILPVYAVRMLFGPPPAVLSTLPRLIRK